MAFDLIGKAVKNLRLPTVDYNNSPTKIIPAQEGDANSRFFNIELYDDRGDISLGNYNEVMLNATLPDGELQVFGGEIDVDNNIVICEMPSSMLTQLGKVSCDICLTGQDSSGTYMSLTSQTFYVFVSKSQANDGAVEGMDDYKLLVKLLREVSALEEEIKASESARVVSEEIRADAEEERVAAEIVRQATEAERATSETLRQSAETERIIAEKNRSNGIKDVVELPVGSDINLKTTYKVVKGIFTGNGTLRNDHTCHVVEWPNGPTGEGSSAIQAVDGKLIVTGYYNITDDTVYGYLDKGSIDAMKTYVDNSSLDSGSKIALKLILSALSTGWKTLEDMLGKVGTIMSLSWGGTITSIEQAVADETLYVLLFEEIYSYKNGTWMGLDCPVGRIGGGAGAEVFNNTRNIATGDESHAEGHFTKATADYAHSEGYCTEAGAGSAHAEGAGTKALAVASHTEGRDTIALGDSSHVGGTGHSTASWQGSFVHGRGLQDSRWYQAVFGLYNKFEIDENGAIKETTDYLVVGCGSSNDSRDNCFTVGKSSVDGKYLTLGATKLSEANLISLIATSSGAPLRKGSGANSVEMLDGISSATGYCSIAIGSGTVATKKGALAEGVRTAEYTGTYLTGAHADGSHSEGINTAAHANGAHVEGSDNIAAGANSHVGGSNGSIATEIGSFVHGKGLEDGRWYQAVFGLFNIKPTLNANGTKVDSGEYLVVGCGSSDTSRANCFAAGVSGGKKFIKIGTTTINEDAAMVISGISTSLPITKGGTGAVDAATARANLGIPTITYGDGSNLPTSGMKKGDIYIEI